MTGLRNLVLVVCLLGATIFFGTRAWKFYKSYSRPVSKATNQLNDIILSTVSWEDRDYIVILNRGESKHNLTQFKVLDNSDGNVYVLKDTDSTAKVSNLKPKATIVIGFKSDIDDYEDQHIDFIIDDFSIKTGEVVQLRNPSNEVVDFVRLIDGDKVQIKRFAERGWDWYYDDAIPKKYPPRFTHDFIYLLLTVLGSLASIVSLLTFAFSKRIIEYLYKNPSDS